VDDPQRPIAVQPRSVSRKILTNGYLRPTFRFSPGIVLNMWRKKRGESLEMVLTARYMHVSDMYEHANYRSTPWRSGPLRISRHEGGECRRRRHRRAHGYPPVRGLAASANPNGAGSCKCAPTGRSASTSLRKEAFDQLETWVGYRRTGRPRRCLAPPRSNRPPQDHFSGEIVMTTAPTADGLSFRFSAPMSLRSMKPGALGPPRRHRIMWGGGVRRDCHVLTCAPAAIWIHLMTGAARRQVASWSRRACRSPTRCKLLHRCSRPAGWPIRPDDFRALACALRRRHGR